MTDVPAPRSRLGIARPTPREGDRTGTAPLKGNHDALPQIILFWAGAILLPLGLVITIGCYWGAASTPYQYDQLAYLAGGLVGLGLSFIGGFLYFGAWLARMAADGRESSKRLAADARESSKRLADTLLLLVEVTSKSAGTGGEALDFGAVLVTTGSGTTLHRRDCSFIARRDDLVPVEATGQALLTRCRVCLRDAPPLDA
jgi:hypothetical protein